MIQEAKKYFLKEYGSWSVLIVAFLTGLLAARGSDWKSIPLLIGLGLLINSKQAFTIRIRRKEDMKSLFLLLAQIAAAAVILFALYGSGVPRLLPLLIFPAAYLLMNKFAGEHFLLTEILGFALISLAAVLANFLITGTVDVRLFIAVALYFTAGVFKVRALLREKAMDRILSVLYVVFAALMYHSFNISLIILLPLIDNLIVAAMPYKVKLRATGWIEVAKSLLFLAFMILFYPRPS